MPRAKKTQTSPTNVFILLDRSGSMSTLWGEAVGSINAYVEELKGDYTITLASFDSQSYDVLRDAIPLDKWTKLHDHEVDPRGSTPLYDAAGKLMDTAFKADGQKQFFVVMTDGYENSSKEYTQAAIKAKLAEFEKRGWATVFLGANFDKVDTVSSSLGVSMSNSVNFARGTMTANMRGLAAKTMAYASGSLDATAMYSAEEKAEIQSVQPTKVAGTIPGDKDKLPRGRGVWSSSSVS